MTISRSFAGGAAALTLNGPMTPVTPGDHETFTTTGTASGWPAANFVMRFADSDGGQEKFLISLRSGNTFTVAPGGRAYDGTSARDHDVNTVLTHVWDAVVSGALVNHANDVGDDHLQYLNVARHDLTARHPAGTVVPTGTPGTLTPGQAAAEGTSPTLARADHGHGMVPWGTTGQLLPLSSGAGDAGTANAYARIDHVHPLNIAALIDAILPAGLVSPWAGPGSTPPTGWLLAAGGLASRTVYARLFAVIGTTYGAGDGSTTFALPDLRERVPVGINTADPPYDAAGHTGGAETVALTEINLPVHHHVVDPPNTSTTTNGLHQHNPAIGGQFLTNVTGGGGYAGGIGGTFSTLTDPQGNHFHTVDIPGFMSGDVGSNVAHENMPPYIVMRYIIKT